MRQRVNFEVTSSEVVGRFFVLRPQSGNEHELTDPFTSLRCLAPVLRCMLFGDQTRPSVGFPLYPF